jgi:hypothetical protein
MVSQMNPRLEQLDFRQQSIELQLNVRHARQLIVQLVVDIVNLSSDVGGKPRSTNWQCVRFARGSLGRSTLASLFHA